MTEIYKPAGWLSLAEITEAPLIRLGIQSPPGKGKTYSALTFPNPVVLDFNKGCGAHIGRPDVIPLPFWDGSFVDKIVKRSGSLNPPNKKDAIIKWLNTEGMKLKPSQTLVADSLTEIGASFHTEYSINGAPTTSKGADDKWDEWKKKDAWYTLLMESIKCLPCNFILITHEVVEWDKQGELTGRCKPILTGAGGDKIVGDFTDWFRQHVAAKPQSPEAVERFKKKYFLNDAQYKEIIESTPSDHSSVYMWQVVPDENFELKTSSLFNPPKFVVANYTSFLKYKRNINKVETKGNVV